MEQIHLYIRELREQNRYSQRDIADYLGLTQTSYREIEIGNTKLTIDRLFELAEVLKVSPEDILYRGKAGDNRTINSLQQQIDKLTQENEVLRLKLHIAELEKELNAKPQQP